MTSSMLVFNTTVLLFLASYVILKRRHPEKQWLYGKTWVAAAFLIILPAMGSIAMVVFTIIGDYRIVGIPRINLVSYCVIVGTGIILHLLLLCSARRVRLLEGSHHMHYEMANLSDDDEAVEKPGEQSALDMRLLPHGIGEHDGADDVDGVSRGAAAESLGSEPESESTRLMASLM